jgi:hypothetical protein
MQGLVFSRPCLSVPYEGGCKKKAAVVRTNQRQYALGVMYDLLVGRCIVSPLPQSDGR